MSRVAPRGGPSGRSTVEGRGVGPLRRWLGIPYPWPIAATWPILHRRPSLVRPDGFRPLGPGSNSADETPSGVHLAFLGDIMPVRDGTELEIDPELRKAIAAADLVVANCESPIGPSTRTRGTRFRMGARDFERVLAALRIPAGRAIVSVANNHAEDDGASGMARTVSVLEDLGCRVVGARRDMADEPVLIADIGGLRIGIAAWTHWRNRPSREAGVRPWTPSEIMAVDWPGLASSSKLDALVGFPHWDLEFRHYPQAETRAWARTLSERGFRLLVGHHPHVVQGAERMDDSLVFYSCGNAVTNAFCARPWSGRISVLVEVRLDGRVARGRVLSYSVDPLFATGSQSRTRIGRLASEPRLPGEFRRRFDLLFPREGVGSV